MGRQFSIIHRKGKRSPLCPSHGAVKGPTNLLELRNQHRSKVLRLQRIKTQAARLPCQDQWKYHKVRILGRVGIRSAVGLLQLLKFSKKFPRKLERGFIRNFSFVVNSNHLSGLKNSNSPKRAFRTTKPSLILLRFIVVQTTPVDDFLNLL